ncbi:fibrous sheath CABYR-binding protein-like [Chrysemys picta bellii]|uniref:fibrous sheath CABYR-binding protein-like n=1 Tax=Chrysemys picta bellii TaxID=8478 RepID=UPI0032B1646B
MGCQLSKKKGFCRICKKCKDQKAEGAAEINETQAVAHASECTESQPFTGTRKDIEQTTASSSQETPEDTEETLSALQTVQGYEAQTTAQSTGKASQDTEAQPAAKMEQEIGEAEPNTKTTQNRQPIVQTPKDNEEFQHAAEMPVEGLEVSKTLLDAEIKQEPEAQPIKQDWQLDSCITEDYIEDRPALEAMQEAGEMETSVQRTAEIVEVQPTAENMQETHQYTGETQPPLQTAQEREVQPVSETEQETAAEQPAAWITEGAQAAAWDALNTGEAKPITQSMQEIPQHPLEAQSARKRLQGAAIQTSAQATEDTGETQPASETETLLAVESEQEAGVIQSAGERTEETEAWPDADRVLESRAHSVTQDREPAARSLSAACTTEVTKQAEPALQTAQEERVQTTACNTRESWTVQDAAEAYPAAQTKEQTAQLVAQGPLETQPILQTIEAPQGTTKNMQITEDISVGPAEPKASQEGPLEPVTIPIKLTIDKTQSTAQVTQEMETLHPAQTTELKENQGQQNDTDSQSPSARTGYKERRGNCAILEEEDQAPELEATEVPKPEQQQLNVEHLAPLLVELPVSHVPESPVEKCQLLDRAVPKACKSKREEEAENAETPRPSETQGSEGGMALAPDSTANSDTAPASEEPQRTELTDSMSEPYSLCRRTCCT